ncbi:uncharacterized protein LOC144081987 isoform X2 [Stigmatopora argus]
MLEPIPAVSRPEAADILNRWPADLRVQGDGKSGTMYTWLNQDAALPVCPRTLKPLRLQVHVHVQVIFPGCPLEDDAASLNSHHLWSSHQGKTRFNNKNVHVIFPGCPLEDDAASLNSVQTLEGLQVMPHL